MNHLAPPPAAQPPIEPTANASRFVDLSRESHEYGIRENVLLEGRILRTYDAYLEGATPRECIGSVLSYTLHRDRQADRMAVILRRLADDRPVEVTLRIFRHRNGNISDLYLRFAEETEL